MRSTKCAEHASTIGWTTAPSFLRPFTHRNAELARVAGRILLDDRAARFGRGVYDTSARDPYDTRLGPRRVRRNAGHGDHRWDSVQLAAAAKATYGGRSRSARDDVSKLDPMCPVSSSTGTPLRESIDRAGRRQGQHHPVAGKKATRGWQTVTFNPSGRQGFCTPPPRSSVFDDESVKWNTTVINTKGSSRTGPRRRRHGRRRRCEPVKFNRRTRSPAFSRRSWTAPGMMVSQSRRTWAQTSRSSIQAGTGRSSSPRT